MKKYKTPDVIKTFDDEYYAQRRVCELIGCIFFYGDVKVETPNERELIDLLDKLGYNFKNEEELIAKIHNGK